MFKSMFKSMILQLLYFANFGTLWHDCHDIFYIIACKHILTICQELVEITSSEIETTNIPTIAFLTLDILRRRCWLDVLDGGGNELNYTWQRPRHNN